MRKMWFGLLAGLAIGMASAQTAMPTIELTAGFHRIEAEVAANDQARQTGLMNRKAMPQQHGMLFVFSRPDTYCMWMRNTYIPLSVAFIDDDGIIINIEDMQPQTENNHCARKPARFALEMNAGWFAQRGLKPGTKLGGIDKAPRGQ